MALPFSSLEREFHIFIEEGRKELLYLDSLHLEIFKREMSREFIQYVLLPWWEREFIYFCTMYMQALW